MNYVLIVLVSIVAGTTTYTISIKLKRGPIFASAVVTLISGIIFPYLFPEIGHILATVSACASYAGMVSVKKIQQITEMVILSAMVGILFIITTNAYLGVGGKLGTIAALSYFSWIGIKNTYYKVRVQARK